MNESVKATGIARAVDDLGRIVLPKELRRTFRIKDGDYLEIYTTDGCIVLKKIDTKKNVSDIIDDLRDCIDYDGRLSGNAALGQKIKDVEAEIEKALSATQA